MPEVFEQAERNANAARKCCAENSRHQSLGQFEANPRAIEQQHHDRENLRQGQRHSGIVKASCTEFMAVSSWRVTAEHLGQWTCSSWTFPVVEHLHFGT